MRKLFCTIALVLGTAFVVLSCSNLVAPTKVLVKAKPAINLPMGSWKYDVSKTLALDEKLGDFEGVEVYKYKNNEILTYLLRYPLIQEELNFQDYLNDLNADSFATDDAINQKFNIAKLTPPEQQKIELDLTGLFNEIGSKFQGSSPPIPLPISTFAKQDIGSLVGADKVPEIGFEGFSSASFNEGIITLTFELVDLSNSGIIYTISDVGIYEASTLIVSSSETTTVSKDASGNVDLDLKNKKLSNRIKIQFAIASNVTTSSTSLTIRSRVKDVKLEGAERFTISNITLDGVSSTVDLDLPDLIEKATIGQGDFATTIKFPDNWDGFDGTEINLAVTQIDGLDLPGLTGYIGSSIGNANNLNNKNINTEDITVSSVVTVNAEDASFSGVTGNTVWLMADFGINVVRFSEIEVNTDNLFGDEYLKKESLIDVAITDIRDLVTSVTFNDTTVPLGGRGIREGLGVAAQFTKFEVPWLQFKIYTSGQSASSDALIPAVKFESVKKLDSEKDGYTWEVQFKNEKEKYIFKPDDYTGDITINVAVDIDEEWSGPKILKDVYPGEDYFITKGDVKLIFDWDKAVIKNNVTDFKDDFPKGSADKMDFSSLKDTLKGISFKEDAIKSQLYVTGIDGGSLKLKIKSFYTDNTDESGQTVESLLYGENPDESKSITVVKDLELTLDKEDGQMVYTGVSLPPGGNEIAIQPLFTAYASDLYLHYELTLGNEGLTITRDKVGESMKFQADMLIEIPLSFVAGDNVAISFDDIGGDKDLLNREPGGTSVADMIKYVGINFQLNPHLGMGVDVASFKIYAKNNVAFLPWEIKLKDVSQTIDIDINDLPNPFIPVFKLEIPDGQEFSFSKDCIIGMKSIGLTADIEQSYDL
jgi:hypothetical protein